MLHIALLHCSKLFIINNKYNYFSLNLQSALTTDFINHHNVLLCRLNVGYAARLNVASWSSTTVICHFISMLLSSSPFSSVVCSTVKAPPTGVGDVLQRIQSDSLGSCARDLKSGYVWKMNPGSGKLDFMCMGPKCVLCEVGMCLNVPRIEWLIWEGIFTFKSFYVDSHC